MGNLWMVRAGSGGAHAELCEEEGFVGVGFGQHEFDELPMDLDKVAMLEVFRGKHPGLSRGKLLNMTGQFYRFLHELKAGDEVVTYDVDRRVYLYGKLSDQLSWGKNRPLAIRRKVSWLGKTPRDSLSVATRNTLGSVLSLFLVSSIAADDVRANVIGLDAESLPPNELRSAVPKRDEETTSIDDLREEVVEKSAEFVEDLIASLDPYELQDLVAGILRAMGYKTRVSAKGADRGVDIFASPDGLGLEEPRIFVEVKHRPNSTMGSQEVRAFLGGRGARDRCLYVSTGGFTREARYEAERSPTPLTLITLTELRELLLEQYDGLDAETRQLVPLTRIYWPLTVAKE